MNVLILGSNGFLGSYLKNNLKYNITSITRKELDLTNLDQVKYYLRYNSGVDKFDVIINCAIVGGSYDKRDGLKENLSVFMNFFECSHLFGKYINIGSGAEFDKSKDITNAREEQIFTSSPKDDYGYVKNIISRLCYQKSNFYTLRLFGCYDKSESKERLFKKLQANKVELVKDRYFDYISARDFSKIVDYYCSSKKIRYKDINCVYSEKYKLSQLISMFDRQHNVKIINEKLNIPPDNYTGCGNKLDSLSIILDRQEYSIEQYG